MLREEILTPSEQFLLNTRLSAIQECIRRTRLALLVAFFAALVTLISLCNAEWSMDKLSSFSIDRFTEDMSPAANASLHSAGQDTVLSEEQSNRGELTKELRSQLVSHWMNGMYISIPVLGVTVSAIDFAIYNSLAMLFLATYLLLSERRENREIGSLLQEMVAGDYLQGATTGPHAHDVGQTVYRAICAFMIFNNPTRNDQPKRSIVASNAEEQADVKIQALRSLIKSIFWFPFASICCTFLYNARHNYRGASANNKPYFILACLLIEFTSGVIVLYFTSKTLGFHDATKSVVSEYRTYTIAQKNPETTN